MKTFEDFLEEYHAEQYPEILDDDLPDAYMDWESGLEADDWMRLANIYGKRLLKGEII
jgi:hypothetical protein